MKQTNKAIAIIATAPVAGVTAFLALTARLAQAARECGDIEQRIESYKDRI